VSKQWAVWAAPGCRWLPGVRRPAGSQPRGGHDDPDHRPPNRV